MPIAGIDKPYPCTTAGGYHTHMGTDSRTTRCVGAWMPRVHASLRQWCKREAEMETKKIATMGTVVLVKVGRFPLIRDSEVKSAIPIYICGGNPACYLCGSNAQLLGYVYIERVA